MDEITVYAVDVWGVVTLFTTKEQAFDSFRLSYSKRLEAKEAELVFERGFNDFISVMFGAKLAGTIEPMIIYNQVVHL